MLDPKRARLVLAVTLLALLASPVSAHLAGLAPAAPSLAPAPLPVAAPAFSVAAPQELAAPAALSAEAFAFRHGRVLINGAPSPVALLADDRDDDAPAPLQFTCPETTETQYVEQVVRQGQNQDRTVYGCPFRVYDTDYHFGNPALAVLPEDPTRMAFFSLHGDPAANGPTPRSRTDLTHTAFTTFNQGLSWEDQPTSYGGGGNGLAYLGESASGAFDSAGNAYAAYLWSLPNGNATTGYAGLIGLYKGGDVAEERAVTDAYTRGHYIRSRTPTNIIANAYIVDVRPREVPVYENLTLLDNATVAPPADPEDVGEEARPINRSLERVVAVWHEKAVDWRNSTTGYAGWIDATVGTLTAKNDWKRLDDRRNTTQLIGPCMDASNPVAWNGLVYVVCVVDNGYGHRSRARIGDLDLWALDPLTGNTSFVKFTGLSGGHPLLAVTPDGYFALVSTEKPESPQMPAKVRTAFGWYGTQWFTGGDMGPELHRLAGNQQTFDVNVNALAITETEKTVALVYMEWQRNRTAQPPDPNAPVIVDPQNPQVPQQRLMDFQKYIVTLNECTAPVPIAASVIQLGVGPDPQNVEAYSSRPSLFDDSQDGLVAYRDPSTKEDRFAFAINDYGAMQVGSVIAAPASIGCNVGVPPANLPPPAIPALQGIPNAAIVVTGSAVGLGAISMVAYLLTVKRRVAHFVTAEA